MKQKGTGGFLFVHLFVFLSISFIDFVGLRTILILTGKLNKQNFAVIGGENLSTPGCHFKEVTFLT